MNIQRPEHPKPQFYRESWENLNGEWLFYIDNGNSGKDRGLFREESDEIFDRIINIPFCPESALSGVEYKDFMPCVWYRRKFVSKEDNRGKRTILHFGACNYRTELWINSEYVGEHIGGYSSFSFDITDYVNDGENTVTVRAESDVRNGNQPSGKQCGFYFSRSCSYTRTTGIWQTVWLEYVPQTYIKSFRCTPSVGTGSVIIEAECANANGKELKACAYLNGVQTGYSFCAVSGRSAILTVSLSELRLWDIDTPTLYDLTLSVGDDTVKSYFGMRTLSYTDGKFMLNGRKVFQRLVLNQGFYPDGIITAPSDEALVHDIELSKSFGFMGARLHQKVFEERFLYHCDRLGYIVWGEHASWGLNTSRDSAWQNFIPEWTEIINRDYNHPSIIGWCPLNESSKSQNGYFVRYLTELTHSLDKTRPVIDASGWWHVGDCSDIIDTHETERDKEKLHARYDPLMRGEEIEMNRCAVMGRPVFVSEVGAMWIAEPGCPEWVIREGMPKDKEDFVLQFRDIVETFLFNDKMWGLCFTQFTDVEQEKNGVCYYDRTPKTDPAVIKKILTQKAACEKD